MINPKFLITSQRFHDERFCEKSENLYFEVSKALKVESIGSGVKGFEPLNVGIKNRCLATWRYSIQES